MRTKTDLLDVAARKLSPYVLLFGCYLVSYGHLSPGGGFQGGVVLASGLILPALGCKADRMSDLLSNYSLNAAETIGFAALFLLGLMGIPAAGFFLADPFPATARPHAWFIFFMNLAIGLKVGAGIGLLSMLIIRTSSGDTSGKVTEGVTEGVTGGVTGGGLHD